MTTAKCPRNCAACASGQGYCHADSRRPEVAAVVAHRGEEPPLAGSRGVCNIFFAHCNLQCVYCQNHAISRATVAESLIGCHSVGETVEAAALTLATTEAMLGLVSATQYADLVPQLVEGLWARGLHPTVVYNTNGYERVETLRALAPYVDIYLPDYKYADTALAARYSNAADYPDVALAALREMVYQKGTALPVDDNGLAFRGIIVRHLVLPGQVENSIACLQRLAEVSTGLHVSLMAQYCPPEGLTLPDALGRRLQAEEYERVKEAFFDLGFYRGWVQELEAAEEYNPHFGEAVVF